MLDPLAVLREARNLGSTATLADVNQVLAQIDRPSLEAQERARYKIEIWDEVSPLGGQPAEFWHRHLKERGDWPEGGKVYCIYIDSRLTYVQPHDPEQAGLVPMSEELARQRAEAHVNRLVEAAVDEQVMREALMKLL